MSFAEIYDAGFRVLRQNPVPTLGLAIPIYIVHSLLQLYAQLSESPGLMGLGMVLLLFCIPFLNLVVTNVFADAFQNQVEAPRVYFGRAWGHYWRFLGTMILLGVITTLAYFLLIIPGIYLTVCWALVAPVVVVEGDYGFAALTRSRELVVGTWWRCAAIVVLTGIITTLLPLLFATLFAFIPLLGPVLSGVVQSIMVTWGLAVVTALYFDLRCRKENFDIQQLAAQVASR